MGCEINKRLQQTQRKGEGLILGQQSSENEVKMGSYQRGGALTLHLNCYAQQTQQFRPTITYGH